MCKEIQLLDCTLRDGGLGIEDYFKRNKKRIHHFGVWLCNRTNDKIHEIKF